MIPNRIKKDPAGNIAGGVFFLWAEVWRLQRLSRQCF
jgi:hypothetical protein